MDALKKSLLIEPKPPRGASLAVGLSGGVDSCVLLHLLHALAPQYDWSLSAVHVHHGLSPHADAWLEHSKTLCQNKAIPFFFKRVNLSSFKKSGKGLEAAAREARYAVFQEMAVDYIVLAHHADDLAETVLLQLFRGGGVRGMAAMPRLRALNDHTQLWRPFLTLPKSALTLYAEQKKVQWVEDESNLNTAFSRNFLRHEILPVLQRYEPAIVSRLGAVADEAAEQMTLFAALAAYDTPQDLNVPDLQTLSLPRLKNVLFHFLKSYDLPFTKPQLTDFAEILSDPKIVSGQVFEVRASDTQKATTIWIYQQRLWVIPTFQTETVYWNNQQGEGLSCQKWAAHTEWTWRFRTGGESVELENRGSSLKDFFHEKQVPPWRRARLPLLYWKERLILIPDYYIHPAFKAKAGEAGWVASCYLDKPEVG